MLSLQTLADEICGFDNGSSRTFKFLMSFVDLVEVHQSLVNMVLTIEHMSHEFHVFLPEVAEFVILASGYRLRGLVQDKFAHFINEDRLASTKYAD